MSLTFNTKNYKYLYLDSLKMKNKNQKLVPVIILIIIMIGIYFYNSNMLPERYKSDDKNNPVLTKQRRYTVKTKKGLLIRESPTIDSKRLGKLPYNYKFNIDETVVNKKDTIIEQGYKIVGNWVPVQTETIQGFVFDGFMKREYDIKHLKYYRLYGTIKSLKKSSYYEEDKEKIKYHSHIKFNKSGNKTHFYDFDKEWELKQEYIYNNKNQLVLKNKYTNFYKYKYDSLGNEIEEFISDKNHKPKDRYKKNYDSKGNKTFYEHYDFEKKINYRSFYTYNNANKPIEGAHYDNEKLKFKYLYKYKNDTVLINKHKIDSLGNKELIAQRILSDSLECSYDKYIEYMGNEIYRCTEKKFNKNKKLINEIIYESAESQPFVFKANTFNETNIKYYKNEELSFEKRYREYSFYQKTQELLVKAVTYQQNYTNQLRYNNYYDGTKESYRTEYYYDYNDKLIKLVEYRENLETISITKDFIYFLDKNGNWTTRQVFKNGKLYKVYKQELEYY